MTIGQNIEQLFGKAAALTGALADGTVFMNDGSPEAAIGSVLEQHGFEKYGNEIFYDGTTGVQMEMSLFIGPVFEMKLKHMVEDKWQARGQGRKEKITHQPTGGRGAQGGLKIGEMDRDAIVGHAMAAFQRESFMKRSDSAKIQICTGCGTVPIFNPSRKSKVNINQCTLCNGPPKYIGSTNYNMEILPLMKKPKGRIVTVELPYATNVLLQELGSIANIGLRLITTGDTERLRPMETKESITEEDAIKIAGLPLKPIHFPEPFVEERLEQKQEEQQEQEDKLPQTPVTNPENENVLEGAEDLLQKGAEQGDIGLLKEGEQALQTGAVAPINPTTTATVPTATVPPNATVTTTPTATVPPTVPVNPQANDLMIQVRKQEGGMTLSIQQPTQQTQQTQSIQQIQQVQQIQQTANTGSTGNTGNTGNTVPRSILRGGNTVVYPPAIPGYQPTIAIEGGYQQQVSSNPIFAIDTSIDAMMADGLMPMMSNPNSQTRRFNRGPLQPSFSMMPQQQQQSSAPSGTIMVNKLG
jgi:hypothetical protein